MVSELKVEQAFYWPTPTYYFKIDKYIDGEFLKKDILEREKNKDGFQFSSIQGSGWQSHKDLLKNEIYLDLKKCLHIHVKGVLEHLYRDGVEIILKQSWANVSRKSHFTQSHIHEGTHWALVYYVTPTKDAGLYFKDPRIHRHMDTSQKDLRNGFDQIITKKPFESGECILFPSWLTHGVHPNMLDYERISIAANYIVR